MVSRFLLILMSLLLAGAVAAQSLGGIQGVITDNTGAVIPGAEITITNIETGVTQKVKSNQVGFYTVPALNPGLYRIAASVQGFASQERPQVRLEVSQTLRADFEMAVGNVAEVMEVSASAVLLQTEKTDVGQVIDSKRIVEMPLNGRNYLQLAQFAVGVLPSRQLGRGTRQDGERGGEGGFRAMGMNAAQNNILLDGADNSSRNSGGALGFQSQSVKPPVDSVGEFKVVTNNMSAEYGYRAGAKVIVSTKSGTNQFHGSLYEFLRNDKLDGSNFFANRSGSPKPTFRQNQFGATFGGPVIKNKTFFFGSYQGTRIRLGQSFISTVPSLEVRNGNFSNQPEQNRNVYDPLTIKGTGANATRSPFPGNIIPVNRFDPVAKRVMDLYPLPNIAGRENLPDNYFYSPSDSDDTDQYDFRGDHNFNESHRFFVRYSKRNQFALQNGVLPFPATGGTGQTIDLNGNNLAAALSSAFGATKFNELRFGYTYFPTRFDIPFTENLNPELGIKGAPGDQFGDGLDHGMTRFSPSGFAQVGPRSFWPNINNLDNYQIADSFSLLKGSHTIKFGGEWRRTQIFREAMRFRRGQFSFNGVYTSEKPNVASSRANTGNSAADMLLGYVGGGSFGQPQGEDHVVGYWGFFLQDDWKINSRLTLNAGLRWELFGAPTFPNPEEQTVIRYLTYINGVPLGQESFTRPTGSNDCGCKNDFDNFAPRLGIAYRITDRTVFRAGGGIYYGEADNTQSETARFYTGAPLATEINLSQFVTREDTTVFVQEGFPVFVPGDLAPGSSVNTTPDFMPTFYAGQWFADLQQNLPGNVLLTIGYNGTKSTHLWSGRNLNDPLAPHPTIRAQDRRTWPQFNNVTLHDSFLNASFNSLTIKGERRFIKGFTFLSSFTWSHNINYGNENLEQGGSGRAWDWNIALDKGDANLDRRLASVTSVVYELPFGKGKQWLQSGPGAWVLGGWELGGIVSFLSGVPVDHSINVDNQNLGGRVRGDWVANPNLPASERTIDRWFNTEFVVPSGPGVISNAGRNVIRAPGTSNLDVLVARNFALPWEGHSLQFRFESFNFTNTPKFGVPNTSVGTPGVGRITEADDPRRIQFALKYYF